MKITRALLFATAILSLAAVSFGGGPAWALLDGLLGKKKTSVQSQAPLYPVYDEETFKAAAKSFHRIPFNDPQLEFDILLPKDWIAATTTQTESVPELRRKILGDIARFKSPIIVTSQATIVIQSVQLDHEILAENWLKNYIFLSGFSLDGEVIPVNEKRANAYFISASEEGNTYRYATVQINGNIAVIAQFQSPAPLKEPLAFLQKRSIDSFRLILTTEDTIETPKNFIFTDALKFTYPESWVLYNTDLTDTYNQSAQLHNVSPNHLIEGVVRLMAIKRNSQTNLQLETIKQSKYFDEFLGLEFKKLVSSAKAPAYERFLFSRYEVYQVAKKKLDGEQKRSIEQELRFAVLGDKEWYIFMFLLTPAEPENLYTWARNTRTFDLIIKKMR